MKGLDGSTAITPTVAPPSAVAPRICEGETASIDASAAGAVAEKAKAVTGNEEVPPSKELTALTAELDKAEEELREMQTVKGFGAGHPDVTRTTARIATLKRQVEEQLAKDVAAYKEQTERAATAGADLPKALPRGRARIEALDKELARLKKDPKLARSRDPVRSQPDTSGRASRPRR